MEKSTHSFKYKWHSFWLDWHETKEHYYGSSRHQKKKIKHAFKAATVKNDLLNLSSTSSSNLEEINSAPVKQHSAKLNPKVTES
ncbi:hypothetical protein CR203_19935 [Salipaludibacillus neizhouensis]|uniref:Uncharacterized protein n=1 Tax=Salipaludibacillus neizhouensis TaxID=885475 RepID=A0A3A9JXH8_9BACI|nr:hypothetical protein [Salipaludibacillus neizhouensis]RKL65594.1 hypothetical protein CR203_19935 [Salipaludibacillus neizhouensis]